MNSVPRPDALPSCQVSSPRPMYVKAPSENGTMQSVMCLMWSMPSARRRQFWSCHPWRNRAADAGQRYATHCWKLSSNSSSIRPRKGARSSLRHHSSISRHRRDWREPAHPPPAGTLSFTATSIFFKGFVRTPSRLSMWFQTARLDPTRPTALRHGDLNAVEQDVRLVLRPLTTMFLKKT